jgi:hypothetical protein
MDAIAALTSRSALERAMEEFDRVGRAEFLKAHETARAQDCFIDHGGHYYDAPVIAAAGYALEHPAEPRLIVRPSIAEERSVRVALERLGLRVVANPYRYLVLAENEVHARPEFIKWKDVTGEHYHYPNNYRNIVLPGREFIYYKGRHRKEGPQAMPEYFGWGRIGAVYPDPATTELPKSKRHWVCDIEEYREFRVPVPFRQADGRYRELDSTIPPQRHWTQGVRKITDRAFVEILEAAGILLKQPDSAPDLQTQTVSVANTPLELLVQLAPRKGDDGSTGVTSHDGTGSRFANRGLRCGSGRYRGAEPHTKGSRRC